MNLTLTNRSPPAPTGLAPRERILAAARELFYRHGIRAVGVDAIAEAADTNKMTLYRHFESKDELVADCLRVIASELEADWDEVARAHPGDPLGQLKAWMSRVAEFKLRQTERGCAFVNVAVELADKNHPACRVVEEFKNRQRAKFVALCREAGLRDPEFLADQLFLLCEGARVSVQSVGPDGPARRLAEMLHGLIAAHAPRVS
jgi:AcrR family transcriptional regulator